MMRRFLRPLPLAIGAMALVLVLKVSALMQRPGAPAPVARAGQVVMPAAQAAEPPPHATSPDPSPPVVVPAEPPVNEAERALLMDLRARRVALDVRTQAVETREAVLVAAERRMSERVEQLAVLQTRLEALEGARRERDDANWRGLVKTYEAMRPRDAAAIFNELEQAVLMQVLDRMKEAKAAAILSAMQPDRARAATSQLAQWRSRTTSPGPGG